MRYTATIDNVRETVLHADADPEYWGSALAAEGLFPFRSSGHADVMISATDLAWKGLRFRELVVALFTSRSPEGETCDGAYLVGAVNSSRLLAWSERAFFRTPYRYGRIEYEHGPPLRVDVVDSAGARPLTMRLADVPRECAFDDTAHEGPIDLPGRRVFYVKLAGAAEVFPFQPGVDEFQAESSERHPVFQMLRESRCAPREWRIRRRALHARSRTFRRKS